MAEKKVRIDEDTNKELLLLTISEDERSMGKMIKKLIKSYKKSKGAYELTEFKDDYISETDIYKQSKEAT